MRLTVIVCEFGAAANVGADVERSTKTFELNQEISDFIKQNIGKWTTVSIAIDRDEEYLAALGEREK